MSDRIMVFIPMYNCKKQIIRVLEQLRGEIKKYISQVVIINNCSTDGGEDAVVSYLKEKPLSIPVKLLRNKENYGLGGSHKVAFQYAMDHGFDYLVVLHGDDQGHIENLLPYLKNGEFKKYDCFLGARFKKGSQLDGYSRFRTFGNMVYNLLFSFVVHYMVYDLGSGLNMYHIPALKSKFYLKFKDNLEFNCYMLLAASYYHQKIAFFPIRWSESDQVSNVKMVNQALSTLHLLWEYFSAKRTFITAEHRVKIIDNYSAKEIYVSKSE